MKKEKNKIYHKFSSQLAAFALPINNDLVKRLQGYLLKQHIKNVK